MDDVSQAQEAGAQVKEGEKGTPIIYWKFEEERGVRAKAAI